MKFMFIGIHPDGEEISLEANVDQLEDVRAAFYRFLAGCGYDVMLIPTMINPVNINIGENDD